MTERIVKVFYLMSEEHPPIYHTSEAFRRRFKKVAPSRGHFFHDSISHATLAVKRLAGLLTKPDNENPPPSAVLDS